MLLPTRPAELAISAAIPEDSTPPGSENWIWTGRIRAGDLVTIVGDPGVGKTTLIVDWIIRLTTGSAFPEMGDQSPMSAGEVVVLNPFCDFECDLRARVEQAGGDPRRVIDGWELIKADAPCGEGGARQCDARFVEQLGRALRNRPTVRMVIIDSAQLQLAFPDEKGFHQMLVQLACWARHRKIAIVLTVTPDRKRRGPGPEALIKSRSLIELSNSIWRLTNTPAETEPMEGRLLVCLKQMHEIGRAHV